MENIQAAARRLSGSPVAWVWALNGFQAASALLLLPLVTRLLPDAEFGMYYVLLGLAAFVPIIDFGFSVSIGRYVSYAMGGATELQALGMGGAATAGGPNLPLLWQLLDTVRRLYRWMALFTLAGLGAAGTIVVSLRVHETASPQHTWLAWAVTLLAAAWEIYAGWWNVFLRGMNQVLVSTRVAAAGYALKLLLAAALLLGGAGLLALPAAGLLASLLQRHLARMHCLRLLGGRPADGNQGRPESLLRLLWPNSWRAGVQFLTNYLTTHLNTFICLQFFGLATTGKYGLSLQITTILQGMAMAWTAVKWPLVGQHRARRDFPALRRLLQPRVWLQTITFVPLALAAFWLAPPLLRWQGGGKELLPEPWFALLLLNAFLQMHFSFWTTLLSIENRIPSFWSTVATNAVSLIAVTLLLAWTPLGVGAFVVAPLCAFALFCYWYWPLRGARSLDTTWLRFTFGRPH